MSEKMSEKKFIKELMLQLKQFGIKTASMNMKKQNISYTAIYKKLKKNETGLSILINADELYELYLSGKSMESIVKYTADAFMKQNGRPEDSEMAWMDNWNIVKTKLFISLCNINQTEYIQNLVYEKIQGTDLVIIPRIQGYQCEGGSATLAITQKLAEIYQMDNNKIIKAAKNNSSNVQPAIVSFIFGGTSGLTAVVYDEKTKSLKHYGDRIEEKSNVYIKFVIVDSSEEAYGSAVLFYDGILEKLVEILDGEPLYIIPAGCNGMYVIPESIVKKLDCIDKNGSLHVGALCSRLDVAEPAKPESSAFLSSLAYVYQYRRFSTIKTV